MTSRNIFWWDNDNYSMHCLDWTMVSSSIYIEGSLQTAILKLIQEQKRLVFVWFFLLEGKSTELSFPKRATTLSGRRSGSHVRSESKRLPKKIETHHCFSWREGNDFHWEYTTIKQLWRLAIRRDRGSSKENDYKSCLLQQGNKTWDMRERDRGS